MSNAYNVDILKDMIDNLTMNIRMFQSYNSEYAQKRMYDMVKERRDLAALVENNGERMEGVSIDLMAYCSYNTDTSWWTKGT